MKFVGVFIFVCLTVCCVNSATVTTWGNTNHREMGRHREFALPNSIQFYPGNQFQIRNFTYPRVRNVRSINTELSLTLSFIFLMPEYKLLSTKTTNCWNQTY